MVKPIEILKRAVSLFNILASFNYNVIEEDKNTLRPDNLQAGLYLRKYLQYSVLLSDFFHIGVEI